MNALTSSAVVSFGSPLMAIIIATLLLFLAGPFVLWPLIKTPPEP